MHYLRWAFRNLVTNSPKYFSVLVLMAITTTILCFFDAVYFGYQKQIFEFQRVLQGDLSISTGQLNATDLLQTLANEPEIASHIAVNALSKVNTNVSLVVPTDSKDVQVLGLTQAYLHNVLRPFLITKAGTLDLVDLQDCLVDNPTAIALGLKVGDEIILYVHQPTERIITQRLVVTGIYVGNRYVQSGIVYCMPQIAAKLQEKSDLANYFLIKFDEELTKEQTRQLAYDIKVLVGQQYPKATVVVPLDYDHTLNFFQIFEIFRTIVRVIRNMLALVMLIIIFIEIQNAYYLIINKRNKEIATLFTYGMSPLAFHFLVLAEVVLLNIAAWLVAVILSILVFFLLANYPLALKVENLVVLTGSPFIKLEYNWVSIITMPIFILATSMLSAGKSIRRYLKKEIRAISAESV